MQNSLGRSVPSGMRSFSGSSTFVSKTIKKQMAEIKSTVKDKFISSISEAFDQCEIKDGMTLSFHHHLRSGDYVLNMVCEEIKKRDLKNITLAPSAIFPTNKIICELIDNKNVTNIYTNYLNGPVAKHVSLGKMDGLLVMQTHGGRPRSIEMGELEIDVCFLAVPTATKYGDGNGIEGKSACGALGYIISDMKFAKKKVIITDHLVENILYKEIEGKYIDYVVNVPSIGDPKGIVSGTTKVTKDPIGLKIARDATKFLNEAGYIKPGFSMQTGAGGTSLAVASKVKEIMKQENIKARMASGGITSYFVEMLEEGIVEKLMDVQCFDLDAVRSYKENKNHYAMSASKYANPNDDPVVNQLDFVILGATEVDINFNINVTTDSLGYIMGGSGGHSDTAYGAKLTLIATPLIKSRTPIIKNSVTTITTPGEDIDVIVTERGIAVNPNRKDLLEKMKHSRLNIMSIQELYDLAIQYTSVPKEVKFENRIIGVVEYRDGTIIDSIYQCKG